MLTGQLYYNANMKMMFGYADSDLQNGLEWWKSNIHPDDKEKILDKIEAAFKLRNITNLNNEYRFLHVRMAVIKLLLILFPLCVMRRESPSG